MTQFARYCRNYLSFFSHSKCNVQCVQVYQNRRYSENDRNDKPLKFSGSPAFSWKAAATRQGYEEQPSPWYQPLVVSLSLGVFLLYFCLAREENDLDIELGKTLYDRIEGLEEMQLKASLKYNEEHGLDTSAIRERLRQIQREK